MSTPRPAQAGMPTGRPGLGRRLLPSPGLSALLFVLWPMLNASASAGQLLLAALFAFTIPLFTRRFNPETPRLKAFGTLLTLAGHVLWDIVVSNIEVARRVLGREAAIHPRFVWVPLALRSPHGLVALAGIITLTPGTISSELSEDRRFLLVHSLHCPDDAAEAALIASIRARYEAPLVEIFD